MEEQAPNLSNPEVVDKYKAAADVANRVVLEIIAAAQPGVRIVDLCTLGDNRITELVDPIYKQKTMKKGIAFPTCISKNNVCGHYSPLSSEANEVLDQGDLVKVDLAVHVDGFIAPLAHTFIVTGGDNSPISGRAADVICAAHFAGQCALRLFRPGKKASEVAEVINDVAKVFNCVPLENVRCNELNRNSLDDSEKFFAANIPKDDPKFEDFEFLDNEVYSVDIIMSTGEGKPKDLDSRTTVFRRDEGVQYSLKGKNSRQFYAEATQRYGTMAFSIRSFSSETIARLGIKECQEHGLVRRYPVLYEKPGEFVAQFKFLVLILPASIQRMTGTNVPLPFVNSQFSVQEPRLVNLMNMGLKRNKKNKKKRGKKPANPDAMDTTA